MSRKTRKIYFLMLAVLALGAAVVLVMTAMKDNLVFFYSPTDLIEKGIDQGQRFRVGGLVEEGSVQRNGDSVSFTITDGLNTVVVAYTGFLPDLFKEGQGVVTEGRMGDEGTFIADSVLAKHDENYMPPEVADSLKETGQWQHSTPDEGKMPDFLNTGARADDPSTPPEPPAATGQSNSESSAP